MAATDPASAVSTSVPGRGHPDSQTDPGSHTDSGGRSDPHGRSDQRGPRPLGGAMAGARVAIRAPFAARPRRGTLFCLAGLPFGVVNPVVVFFVVVDLLWAVTPHRPPNPSWPDVAAAGVVPRLWLPVLGGA